MTFSEEFETPRLVDVRKVASIVGQLLIALALLLLVGLGVAFFARHQLFRVGVGLPSFSHTVAPVRQTKVVMRDGVKLSTQVVVPEGRGPWPTVVIRNPYNILRAGTFFCEIFARYGYACVHQDVRGRMGSEGAWKPLVHEREDGLDLFDWLKEQDFQNGKWGLWGMSYLSAVHWSLADSFPEEVKTFVSMVFGVDTHEVMYQGGLFRHDVFSAWAAVMPGRDFSVFNTWAYPRFIRARPHRTADQDVLGVEIDWYRDWVDTPNPSAPLWSEPPFTHFLAAPRSVEVPVLMVGGYFDPFFEAQRRDFERLGSRAKSKLIIGPWHHLQAKAADFATPRDLTFGGQWRTVLDWLDHHLRDQPSSQTVGVVETYDMGAGGWRQRPAFPPAPTAWLRFHLTELQRAKGPAGGEMGTRKAFRPEEPVRYLYDPDDPAPSIGGSSALGFAFMPFPSVRPGARKELPPAYRADLLSFVSKPLRRALHLAGSPRAHLRVSSSAEDTAFGFKLMVSPKGSDAWFHVREGYTALSARTHAQTSTTYTPGSVVGVDIDAWPIEWTFPEGARLRVDIRSASFPLFAAHPNVSGPWGEAATSQVAEQTVFPGSWVELPVHHDEHPVLSASALGTVPPTMACTFDIDLTGSPDEIVQKAKQMIEDAGGSFTGDTGGGNYTVKIAVGSVEGAYSIQGGSIRFDITKKPMLVPCAVIETFLRDRFKRG